MDGDDRFDDPVLVGPQRALAVVYDFSEVGGGVGGVSAAVEALNIDLPLVLNSVNSCRSVNGVGPAKTRNFPMFYRNEIPPPRFRIR